MFAALVEGGARIGLTPDIVAGFATASATTQLDKTLRVLTRFGPGFMLGTVMRTCFTAEHPDTNLILDASMILNTPGDAAKGVERPAHALNCTKPVVTEADLQVARLRIGGANRARWSEAMGATPVTMSGNEMLVALAQGVLDCSILSVPDVQNFGMGASVKHITPGEPGGVCVASQTNMNKDTWTSLSDPERGAEMLADFKVIPEKWVGLIQGVSTPEALGDLCWSAL